MECADKGNTGHKERAIDVPNGKMPSVCLRKHWATGREAKEVVGCWIGLALLWKDYPVCASHGREKIRILVWKEVGLSLGLDACGAGLLCLFGEWEMELCTCFSARYRQK